MIDDHAPSLEPARLSDEAAHRLLARAIELDHDRGAESTVTELRAIALEAGISPAAFEAAVRELATLSASATARDAPAERAPPSTWHRLIRRKTTRGIVDATISNTASAVLSWLLIFLLTRIAQPIGWQAMEATILIGCVLGIGVARKFGARLAEIAMMGLAAFQAAEFAMHLAYGQFAVQGAPTHFAVMAAGVLGAAIGWAAGRERQSPLSNAPPVTATTRTQLDDIKAEPPRPSDRPWSRRFVSVFTLSAPAAFNK